jgi:dTDP-4-dehydrorhamnose reductase
MNILVTGCYGQLGTELQKVAVDNCAHQWFFTDIDTLDICDLNAVERYFAANGIEVCINCAAYTAVDKAEDEPDLAAKVNVAAPKNLAECCQRHNALLIHVSTDYVFDGQGTLPYRESDATGPTSVYGQTKLDGEHAVIQTGCRYCIVRTAWLYSSTGKNFVKTMLMLGDTKDEINVVNNQKGCPTWASDLAHAIYSLVEKYRKEPVHETFHFTNEGQITWYDFACAIMEIGGRHCKVNPITTDQYPTKAKRPAYSVLDLNKIKSVAGMEIPYWRNSLEKCIEEINKKN